MEDLVNSRFDKLELKIASKLAQHYRLPLDNLQRHDTFFNPVRTTSKKKLDTKNVFERELTLSKRNSTIEKN